MEVKHKRCEICNEIIATTVNGNTISLTSTGRHCSPECARTSAIVHAVSELADCIKNLEMRLGLRART